MASPKTKVTRKPDHVPFKHKEILRADRLEGRIRYIAECVFKKQMKKAIK